MENIKNIKDSIVAKFYSEKLQANVCVALVKEISEHEVILALTFAHPKLKRILDTVDMGLCFEGTSALKNINMQEVVETYYINYITYVREDRNLRVYN